MRVAVDARMWEHSGAGRYLRELYARLPARLAQWQWILLTNPSVADRVARDAPLAKVEVLARDCPIYSLREQWTMARALDALGADLVHIPHFNVPLLLRTPRVVTLYDLIYLLFPDSCPSLPARLYARLFYRWAARSSKRVLTISEASRRDIVRHLGVAPEAVAVTRCGAPSAGDGGDEARAGGASRFGLDGPYVLYVGLQLRHKNLPRLVEAFHRVRDALPNLRLVLAGRIDRRRRELTETIRRLGLEERVLLTDVVTDGELAALYRGARLYATPSLYEGFGLTPLEAMAYGVPVAASSAGSLPEVLGEAALFFDPTSVDEMADALQQGLVDEAARRSLVEKGRARAAHFRWDDCARETADVFEDLARQG